MKKLFLTLALLCAVAQPPLYAADTAAAERPSDPFMDSLGERVRAAIQGRTEFHAEVPPGKDTLVGTLRHIQTGEAPLTVLFDALLNTSLEQAAKASGDIELYQREFSAAVNNEDRTVFAQIIFSAVSQFLKSPELGDFRSMARIWIELFDPEASIMAHGGIHEPTSNFLTTLVTLPDDILSRELKKKALRHTYALMEKFAESRRGTGDTETRLRVMGQLFRLVNTAKIDAETSGNWDTFDSISGAYTSLLVWSFDNALKSASSVKMQFLSLMIQKLFDHAENKGVVAQRYLMNLFMVLKDNPDLFNPFIQGIRDRYPGEIAAESTPFEILTFLAKKKFFGKVRALDGSIQEVLSYDGAMALFAYVMGGGSIPNDPEETKAERINEAVDAFLNALRFDVGGQGSARLNGRASHTEHLLRSLFIPTAPREDDPEPVTMARALAKQLRGRLHFIHTHWLPAYDKYDSSMAASALIDMYTGAIIADIHGKQNPGLEITYDDKLPLGTEIDVCDTHKLSSATNPTWKLGVAGVVLEGDLEAGLTFIVDAWKGGNRYAEASLARILGVVDPDSGREIKLGGILHRAGVV